MIYLVKTNDLIYLDQTLKMILEKEAIEYLVRYDLEETNLSKAIEDLDTYSFLDEKKAILITRANFLKSSSKKDALHNEELLEKYLNNPNPNNVLIIAMDELDARKKLVKLLLEKANKVYEKNLNLEDLVKDNLENFSISNYALNYFISFCDNNSEKILNELHKIKAYKESGEITVEDIDLICYSSYEANIFKFIDELILGDKTKALEMYRSLAYSNEAFAMILAMTHDHFNLVLNVKNLASAGHKTSSIQKELKQKSLYRIEKILSYNMMYSNQRLLKILNDLCDIDIANKSNSETYGLFECFIMEL